MDARDVFDKLISAHRDVALCENALEAARHRHEAAAEDLRNAQEQVKKCQEDIDRMARGDSRPREDDDAAPRGNGFVPYRR